MGADDRGGLVVRPDFHAGKVHLPMAIAEACAAEALVAEGGSLRWRPIEGRPNYRFGRPLTSWISGPGRRARCCRSGRSAPGYPPLSHGGSRVERRPPPRPTQCQSSDTDIVGRRMLGRRGAGNPAPFRSRRCRNVGAPRAVDPTPRREHRPHPLPRPARRPPPGCEQALINSHQVPEPSIGNRRRGRSRDSSPTAALLRDRARARDVQASFQEQGDRGPDPGPGVFASRQITMSSISSSVTVSAVRSYSFVVLGDA